MKKIITLLFITISYCAVAQLHVSPTTTEGSYVYVSDTFIYVENDVDLETNSTATSPTTSEFPNIILRNEAQLLQGNGSISQQNDGSGILSVYQEGTSSQYVYNFWGSPVGLSQVSGSTLGIGNTDFAFRATGRNLFQPTSEAISAPAAIIAPNGGFNGSTSNGGALNIASFWLFKFTGGSATAQFIPVQNTGSVAAGLGFTMKGVSGTDNTTVNGVENNSGNAQRYDFRGRPHNGTIDVDVLDTTIEDNILVGNPYPSALDLSYFLLENALTGSQVFTDPGDATNMVSFTANEVLDGIAYFWDQANVATHFLEEYEGGYGTFSPMCDPFSAGVYMNALYFLYDEDGNQAGAAIGSGGNFNRRFSPVGQGFFVRSIDTPEQDFFTFRNDHRVFVQEGASSDFRSQEDAQPTAAAPIVGVRSSYGENSLKTVPQIRINVGIDDSFNRELVVAFAKNATFDKDVAMDARSIEDVSADATFTIENQDKFVLNAINTTHNAKLPLVVEATAQTVFSFALNFTIDFDLDDMYLYDAETDVFHDLIDNGVEYILDAGVYTDRFFITFEKSGDKQSEIADWANNGPTSKDKELVKRQLEVFNAITARQNNNVQLLEVVNPQQAEIIGVELFDISGKLILTSQEVGNASSYTFPTGNLATGIYIIRMQTQDGLTKSRKLSIQN